MQAVEFALVLPLLDLEPAKQRQSGLMRSQGFLRHLPLQLPDEHSGHGADTSDRFVAFVSLAQKVGQFSSETSAKADSLPGRDGPAPYNDLGQQLRIGRKGDVFLLDRGVHHDLVFLGSLAVQPHRDLENLLDTLFSDPPAEVSQVGRVTRKAPLKDPLSAKSLAVRVLDPDLDHPFIAQVFHLPEDEQTHHEPDGLGRSASFLL